MNQIFGKYGTMISALISTALPIIIMLWGNGPDAKYVAIASGIAGALGVHVTHVNSTKPSVQQIQTAINQAAIQQTMRQATPQPPPAARIPLPTTQPPATPGAPS